MVFINNSSFNGHPDPDSLHAIKGGGDASLPLTLLPAMEPRNPNKNVALTHLFGIDAETLMDFVFGTGGSLRERTLTFRRIAAEEGFADHDIRIALSIRIARENRLRNRYQGIARKALKVGLAICLIAMITLVHSVDDSPEFLRSISLKSVIEDYSCYESCPLPVVPFESARSLRSRQPRDAADLSFPTEPSDIPPQDSEETARVAGLHDDPEEKLKDCWVKDYEQNQFHFRSVGEITGNDGMIHLAINFNLTDLLFTLTEFCTYPKQIVNTLQEHHAGGWNMRIGAGKGAFWPWTKWHNSSGSSNHLHLIFRKISHRCEMLLEETTSFYHIFMGEYVHGQTVHEPWTMQSDQPHDPNGPLYRQDFETYRKRFLTYPPSEDEKWEELRKSLETPSSTTVSPLNCTQNPYGDPFSLQTWERIAALKSPYNSTMLPRRLVDGNCVLDVPVMNEITRGLGELKAYLHPPTDASFPSSRLQFGADRRRRRRSKSKRVPSLMEQYADYLVERTERIKRFILSLLFAVVAVGSLLFSKMEMDSMAAKANANTDATVSLFNSQDHSLRVHDEAIKTLNQTMGSMMQALRHLEGHVQAIQFALETYVAVDTYFADHVRILRGLNMLLQHRLSPDLVRADKMTQTILEKKAEFAQMGYSLGIETLDDIYRATTSWCTFGNASLFVATHIPIYKTSTRYQLLEPDREMYFAPPAGAVPDPSNDHHLGFRVEGENELLAVSKNGQYYQTLSWMDMERCSRVGSLFVCPNANILKVSRDYDSCLIAMYRGKVDAIRKLCKWRSVTNNRYAIQISGNRYVVRVPEPIRISFSCGGGTGALATKFGYVNDTALVQVAGMCQGTVGDYILMGRLEFSVTTTAFTTQKLDLEDLLREVTNSTGIDWATIQKARVSFDPDGIPLHDVSQKFVHFRENLTRSYITNIVLWSCVAGLGILAVFVILRWVVPLLRERQGYNQRGPPPSGGKPCGCLDYFSADQRQRRRVAREVRRRAEQKAFEDALAHETAQSRYTDNLRRDSQGILKKTNSSSYLPGYGVELEEMGSGAQAPPRTNRSRANSLLSRAGSTTSVAFDPQLQLTRIRTPDTTSPSRSASRASGLSMKSLAKTQTLVDIHSPPGATGGAHRTSSDEEDHLLADTTSVGSNVPTHSDNPFLGVRRREVEELLDQLSDKSGTLPQSEAMRRLLERDVLSSARRDLLHKLLASLQDSGHHQIDPLKFPK